MNPVNRYATSLMDIILGAIGAFFFLLIILSASRRGVTQEGTDLPPNLMTLTVKQPAELKIGKSIHYFVAQLKDEKSNEIEKIFYSDVEAIGGDEEPLVKVSGNLAYPMIMAADNPPPLVVGVWLQDVQDILKPDTNIENDSIKINIACKKIYERNPLGFPIELKKENNYFAAYLLNDGSNRDAAVLQQYGERPLIRGGVPCRSAGEQWEPMQDVRRTNVPESGRKVKVYVDTAYSNEDSTKRHFFKEAGFLKLNGREVDFRFVGGFNSPEHNPDKDPRQTIIDFFDAKPEINIDKIIYLAAGERAVCAVQADGSLLFQGINGKDLSYYPFKQYLTGTIGTIPKNIADKMITKMKQVEPKLQDEEQRLRMLAEIIAAPNNRKELYPVVNRKEPSYPVVRQNPLLWN